ncbi:MAG: hypothetical protein DMG64_18510 [Acidobacteria bacterium]|nr:MAG: hypothetical protein DMG64_18510 [Acidobacteriota bacterium]PYY23227.1 MAG: hypothetical protein DMG62_09020 [Acidobacteriota bacterium]
MHNKLSVTLLFAASFAVSSALASDSDRTDGNSANTAAISTSNKSESTLSNHRPGIAFKTSLLGFGGDVAVPMTRRSNVRVGFAAFNYGRGFDKDGVSYSGRLNLRSMQALYDIFPFGGGFHLSPGVMMYSGNQLSGSAIVPGGQTVTFGGVDYASDPANPLKGNGKLQFSKAGPMFLFGFGNLARRSERHFGMTVDIGAVYQGVPRTTLNFTGGACDPTGLGCRDVSSDPTVQSNIQSEQAKINHSASPLRFYPVISVGFGYKF